MKTTDENYEPYGEEWEKELMKLPKKFIINMYRNVCIKLQDKETEIKELEIMYSEASNIAGMYEERALEAEKCARDTYTDRGW
jgi:predicted Zn-dependent protease with MMP-like domain